ncbi:esterase/lipase family protein [Kineococcus sp. SYSU DK006]|uniref:esterase/lipase family protein n=1 Tax=Kineococcus sp. SYSU DK006 TaxID=3383127 RepID=UPI003D7C3DFD
MVPRAAVVWWACADWWYALRWELRSLRRRASPPGEGGGDGDDGRGAVPVLLIPGVYESWRFLEPLTEALQAGGHRVHVVDALGFNGGEVPEAARAVRRHVDEQGLGLGRPLALVGHSKGGLIGKQLLADDPDGRFRHLVAVNTPFSGSPLARLVPLRAVRAFAPGGQVLRELAAREDVNRSITSISSRVDPNVPGSSRLPGARHVTIDTVGHFRVLADPRLQAAVLDALAALRAPGAPGQV